MMFSKKDVLTEFTAITEGAIRDAFEEPSVTRLKRAAADFVGLVCDDEDPAEVRASAMALTSLAAFITGFAAVRTGISLEEIVQECQQDFMEHAMLSYRGYTN
jgi:hypothetical protein